MGEIQQLDAIDREAYLQAMVAVARADRQIRSAELEFLQNQASALDVDLEPLLDGPAPDLAGIRVRTNAQTRRMIVRDCITLAAVDGEYAESERAHVRQVAEALGVSGVRVAAIEAWLQRYSEVLDEGQRLLTNDDE